MPIPFDQAGTPNAVRNQRARASTSALTLRAYIAVPSGVFLGVAGPMGIGM